MVMFQLLLITVLLAILAAVTAAPQLLGTPLYGYTGYYGTYAYPYSYGGYIFR
jgi:hypothetical protein